MANHSRSHLSFKSFSPFFWGSKLSNFLSWISKNQHLIWYSFKTTSCLPFWQNLAWRTASSTWLRCWIPLVLSRFETQRIRNPAQFHQQYAIISIIESQNEWVSSDWWKSFDLIHRFELEASQLNSSANSDTRTHEKGWLFKPPTTPVFVLNFCHESMSWLDPYPRKWKMNMDATTKQRTNDYSTGNIYPQTYLILHHLIKAPFLRCSVIKHCQWEKIRNQIHPCSMLVGSWRPS